MKDISADDLYTLTHYNVTANYHSECLTTEVMVYSEKRRRCTAILFRLIYVSSLSSWKTPLPLRAMPNSGPEVPRPLLRADVIQTRAAPP